MHTESPPSGSFGELLKRYRTRLRLTQQQLAQKIGVHRNTISQWELGSYLPETRGMVLELARCLELGQDEVRLLLETSLFTFSTYWAVPMPRNPFFTGRERDLQTLHAFLQLQESVALTQAYTLSGLGGVGKTQLVTEYAYHHAEEYRAVFWINAETLESIQASMSTIGRVLHLPLFPDHQHLVDAVKDWLTTQKGWLLIVDNVEQPELVKPLIPAARQGRVLYTTRLPGLGTLAQTLEVTPLSHEESVHLLLLRSNQETVLDSPSLSASDVQAAGDLAILLGGLPLALDQAGAYIEQTKCSLTEFLLLFQRAPLQVLGAREAYAEHPDSVVKTFTLAFERLQQTHAGSAELLLSCCFLASEEIPERLFTQNPELLSPHLQTVVGEPFAFQQLLKHLLAYALIQRSSQSQTLIVHRLVQHLLREQLSRTQQQEWLARLVTLLAHAFPADSNIVEHWPWCDLLLPHALHCLEHPLVDACAGPDLSQLLIRVAIYLYVRAQYAGAETYYHRAYTFQEHSSHTPNRSSQLIAIHIGLADIKQRQAQYAEAEKWYTQALGLLDQAKDSDQSQRIAALRGLAIIYFWQGRYAEAEPLYQRVLSIREHLLGPEHPHVAASLGNLAMLYTTQSRYREAEPLSRRVVRIHQQVYGEDHLQLATPLNNLAILSFSLGNDEEAERLFRQAIRIRERTQASDHPDLVSPLANLAELYTRQRRQREAEELYQRARSILEKRFGPDHPEIGYVLCGLSDLYVSMDRIPEAEAMLQRAAHLWKEEASGNPRSAWLLLSQATLFFQVDRFPEARDCCQRALVIFQQAFGSEHIDVAKVLHLLGKLLLAQKQEEEAEHFLCRALVIRQALLGPEHADTIATRQDIARAQARLRS